MLKYLSGPLQVNEADKSAWYAHWVEEGLNAAEQLLAARPQSSCCVGETPTLADCCLVPQVANAQRMGCALSRFERVMAVYATCMAQPACDAAAPRNQPDYVG